MATDDPMTLMEARLDRHWLWRLRRHAELVALDQAAALGVIDRVETQSGLVIFAMGDRARGSAQRQVRLVLRHAFGIPASGLERSPYPGRYVDGTASPDDDDWVVLGGSKSEAGKAGRPSRLERSGGKGVAWENEAKAASAAATAAAAPEAVQPMLEDRAEPAPASDPDRAAAIPDGKNEHEIGRASCRERV